MDMKLNNPPRSAASLSRSVDEELFAQSAMGASIVNLQGSLPITYIPYEPPNVSCYDFFLFHRHRVKSFITVNETIRSLSQGYY